MLPVCRLFLIIFPALHSGVCHHNSFFHFKSTRYVCTEGFSSLMCPDAFSYDFYSGISEASHVTRPIWKLLPFVCLTSEVRALCLAPCFEVCPQQYGQCPFCFRSSILSETVLHHYVALILSLNTWRERVFDGVLVISFAKYIFEKKEARVNCTV